MKRSQINAIYREARDTFLRHGWALPPQPRWDITDFGLDRFDKAGLVLINLAEEPEYCEKLMYARPNQQTPAHTHRVKKEDIICRHGTLALQLWDQPPPEAPSDAPFSVQINGLPATVRNGRTFHLEAGSRITLTPGIYHAFWPVTQDCIIGEVSTANDDTTDNVFVDPNIGRFPGIEEDEPAEITLVSE